MGRIEEIRRRRERAFYKNRMRGNKARQLELDRKLVEANPELLRRRDVELQRAAEKLARAEQESEEEDIEMSDEEVEQSQSESEQEKVPVLVKRKTKRKIRI